MTKKVSTKVVQKVDVEAAAPQLRLPDANSTAEAILAQTLEFSAQKLKLSSHQAVLEHLRQGDGNAYKYCHYSMAKQVAESIGTLDENVRAVYVADYDATPEDLCFGQGGQPSPVHLIVWAKRKTSALDSLVEALNRALVQRYAELIGPSQLAHLLDVQVVNDADVDNRVGYGALLSSLRNRPIKVWER
jgi:hypothetical protein